MRQYNVCRRSVVKGRKRNFYPRPTEVFERIFSGSKKECENYILERADEKANQSTEDIVVDLLVELDNGQARITTSRRPENGTRKAKD